jgi:anti-anti-sigma factor
MDGGTMQDDMLTVDLSHVNGSAFLILKGDIDAHSVVKLRAVLELHLDKQVVIDMAGVGFMDSSGLNALLDHAVRAADTSGSLRVSNPSSAVRRVVEVTGLAHVLYPTDST